jgi:ATP-binding protein involved in chromosome partitioning
MAAAEDLWAQIEKINADGGVDNQAIQPTTPPGVSACSTSSQPQQAQHSHNGGGSCGCN